MSQMSFLPDGDTPRQNTLWNVIPEIDPSVWLVPETNITLARLVERFRTASGKAASVTFTGTRLPRDLRVLTQTPGIMSVAQYSLVTGSIMTRLYAVCGTIGESQIVGTTACLNLAEMEAEFSGTVPMDAQVVEMMMRQAATANVTNVRPSHEREVQRRREPADNGLDEKIAQLDDLRDQIADLSNDLKGIDNDIQALRSELRAYVYPDSNYSILQNELLEMLRSERSVAEERAAVRSYSYELRDAVALYDLELSVSEARESWDHVLTIVWRLAAP